MLNRKDIKVFIASSGELEAERKESVIIITELNKRYPYLHIEPILYELDTASGNNPGFGRIQDKINPLLDASDIVVVLFFSKVGEFTKEEFDRAKEKNKKIFCYLKKGFAPTKTEEIKIFSELILLKELIEKESKIRYDLFEKLSEFNGKFYKDLQKFLDEFVETNRINKYDVVGSVSQKIPLAPRPYFAPAFGLSKSFTGRIEELNIITQWFLIDREPICVIEAIGGMGKSSLSWKWIQEEIVEKKLQVSGVIWWSFYKQGFDEFIHDTFIYCFPHTNIEQNLSIDKAIEVAKFLSNNKYLLILDGFETELRGYSGLMSTFQNENLINNFPENQGDVFKRECSNPRTESFLKSLCSSSSKILITTRLFPTAIERLSGVKHIKLNGLSKTDTIDFFKKENIIATPSEIIKVAKVYDFHPLMLKLLSTVINRSRLKNIDELYNKNIINEKEPQKILHTSYSVLDKDEKDIISSLSIFRVPFDFEAIKVLFSEKNEEDIWRILLKIIDLGFLSYEENDSLFDIHPVIRFFLYNQLTNKTELHGRAISYFGNQPEKDIIKSINDLTPVFELFFHLVRAGLLKEAFIVYKDRLFKYFNGQFDYPQYDIDLLSEFLSDENLFQNNLDVHSQSYLLNNLAVSLSKVLRTKESIKYYQKSAALYSSLEFDSKFYFNLAVWGDTLKDIGCYVSGRIMLTKAYENISYQIDKTLCFRYLSKVLMCSKDADVIFKKHVDDFEIINQDIYSKIHICKVKLEYSLLKSSFTNSEHDLYDSVNKLLDYINAVNNYENNINQILGEYMLTRVYFSKCFLQLKMAGFSTPPDIIIHSLLNDVPINVEQTNLTDQNFFEIIEKCLYQALYKIRESNSLYYESLALLMCAKFEWLKIKHDSYNLKNIYLVKNYLSEAYNLAKKENNHINQVEIHLFCAEIIHDASIVKLEGFSEILDGNFSWHLYNAKKYSIDNSLYDDIFKINNSEEFYGNMSEYHILKHGMTEEERIERGYYLGWLRANNLEKISNVN